MIQTAWLPTPPIIDISIVRCHPRKKKKQSQPFRKGPKNRRHQEFQKTIHWDLSDVALPCPVFSKEWPTLPETNSSHPSGSLATEGNNRLPTQRLPSIFRCLVFRKAYRIWRCSDFRKTLSPMDQASFDVFYGSSQFVFSHRSEYWKNPMQNTAVVLPVSLRVTIRADWCKG